MDVAAKEATTRTVATKRSTVWCIAAAEAAIPVQATLTAVAEVLTASSSRTESPVRKTEAPAFPSTNRAKAKARSGRESISSHLSFSPIAYSLVRAVLMT
ncbi:hypothetical protein VPH35_134580 [Triticum aestivum]